MIANIGGCCDNRSLYNRSVSMPKFVDPVAVRRLFDYLPEEGRLVRKNDQNGAKAGDLAGYVETAGHRRTWFTGRNELTARMVWAWHTGESPEQPIVHVNGDKSDDRIENLKTRQQLTAERKRPITQELLHEMFEYRDGELIRRVSRAHNAMEGDVAGSVRPGGYEGIHLYGKIYLKHRLIWLYHNGAWPKGEIDHINRIPADSRIENLRDVGRSINSSNRPVRSDNKLGVKGVTKVGNKFITRITSGEGKSRYIGIFDTTDEAHAAFKVAHVERFGDKSEYFKE